MPRGKRQVVRALLDAAAQLLAERGPRGVSVRDVAARAGVNHGLVHRHFGSKSGLVREVMSDLVAQISSAQASDVANPANVQAFFAATERSIYWRVLARALLDGYEPQQLQSSFPVVTELTEQVRRGQKRGDIRSDAAAEVLTAMGVAMALGWLVFEPFLLVAAGLESHARDELRQQAFALYGAVLRGA